jgi:hypothetical protein
MIYLTLLILTYYTMKKNLLKKALMLIAIAGLYNTNVNAQSFTFDTGAQGFTASGGATLIPEAGGLTIATPFLSTFTLSSSNAITATTNKNYKIVIDVNVTDNINTLKIKTGSTEVATITIENFNGNGGSPNTYEGTITNAAWTGTLTNVSFEFSGGPTTFDDRGLNINEITFSGATLGLSDNQKALSSVSLSPVPAKDVLTVASSEKVNNFEVYSLVGKKLFSSNSESINVSNLSTGVYVAKITNQNGAVSTKRFIKE